MLFIENLPKTSVFIRDIEYPVAIDGVGDIPVISIGIGSHMQMTLSSRLKRKIKVYSTDLYWIAERKLENANLLSINTLVDDIISVINQLKLEKPLLVGFSCYGILALEVAKRLDTALAGVVLVSTPPAWNNETIEFAQLYFDQHASEERKLNDRQRKEHFLKIKKPDESIISVNAYEADAARYWKDFTVTRDFLDTLWHGIEADDRIINRFFSDLLLRHDLAKNIEQITIPILLLAGQLDFDSVPLQLWKQFPKTKNFEIIDCGETGHWPNLENPDVFDLAWESWMKENGINLT